MAEPIQQPGEQPDADEAEPMPLPWMPAFLDTLDETGIVRRAARVADVALATAYDARDRHASFAQAWQIAIAGKEYRRRGPTGCAASLPPEPEKPTPTHWRTRFFEALAETSNVSASAAHANVAVRTVYKLRRTEAEFAHKWRAALLEGYDLLEMELLGYLRDPNPTRKMDVAAAIRLLAAHRATVERERALREEEDEQAVRESIDAFLEGIRQRRLAKEAVLIEASTSDVAG